MRARTDPEAFADFYRAYGERALRFLVRRVFDVELAYEMHAETFAVAFERREQFRGRTPEEEQAWLFAIARSQLTAYWRHGAVERGAITRLKLERPALDDEAIERLAELSQLDSLRPRLAAAIAKLPEDQQEAVTLKVVHDVGYADIAARQGVSNALVRARVSRALRSLGNMMQMDDDADGVKEPV